MTKEELKKIKAMYARNRFLGLSAEALILEVERLQSEIERLQSEREWRPIETAPKDGTRILFYTPGDEDGETGYLPSYEVSYFDSTGLETYNVSQWEDGLYPTHWMPLPDSPEGGKE